MLVVVLALGLVRARLSSNIWKLFSYLIYILTIALTCLRLLREFFTSRTRDLKVFGSGGNERVPATSEFIQRLFSESGAFSYLSDYLVKGEEAFLVSGIDAPVSKAREQRFQLSKNALAFSLATHHGPIPAVAWKLEFSGCKIVYAGDMNNKHKRLSGFAKGADLLIVHNAIPEFAGSIA